MPRPDSSIDAPVVLQRPVRRLGPVLGLAVLLLLAGAVGFFVLREWFGRDHVYGLARLFDVDREQSIPTWYATLSLALAAALLGVHAAVSRRTRDGLGAYWLVLAVGFALMSIDEVATIHERLGGSLGDRMVSSKEGAFYFYWVAPALVLVAVVGLAFIHFLWCLPSATRWRLVGAGALFVGGAVGMEMVNGNTAWQEGRTTAFQLGSLVEEALEMSAIALFVHALALHLVQRVGSLSVQLTASQGAAAATARAADRWVDRPVHREPVAATVTSSTATGGSPARTPRDRHS